MDPIEQEQIDAEALAEALAVELQLKEETRKVAEGLQQQRYVQDQRAQFTINLTSELVSLTCAGFAERLRAYQVTVRQLNEARDDHSKSPHEEIQLEAQRLGSAFACEINALEILCCQLESLPGEMEIEIPLWKLLRLLPDSEKTAQARQKIADGK